MQKCFGNIARDNSGGILIFNLPGLPKADGARTRIYNNEIIANNHENFATPLVRDQMEITVTMIPQDLELVPFGSKRGRDF